MQKMFVDKLIEIVKAKNFIKFHVKKIMIHLAWVAYSMVIFSGSQRPIRQYTHNHRVEHATLNPNLFSKNNFGDPERR